jgi:hypothetical protein
MANENEWTDAHLEKVWCSFTGRKPNGNLNVPEVFPRRPTLFFMQTLAVMEANRRA